MNNANDFSYKREYLNSCVKFIYTEAQSYLNKINILTKEKKPKTKEELHKIYYILSLIKDYNRANSYKDKIQIYGLIIDAMNFYNITEEELTRKALELSLNS